MRDKAGITVEPHNVALRIDSKGLRTPQKRSWYIDVDVLKGAIGQQETTSDKAVVQDSKVEAHNVASRIDPKRLRSPSRARYIDFRELGLVRRGSCIVTPTDSRGPRHYQDNPDHCYYVSTRFRIVIHAAVSNLIFVKRSILKCLRNVNWR
jgi:hypothetical protein